MAISQTTQNSPAQRLVIPGTGLNPQVEQVYPIVNAIYKQMTGLEDIQAVDTASLVAMGQKLENTQNLDLWLNTLNRRIGYTNTGYRIYNSKFSDLTRDQVAWGAYVQKITSEMPEATDDKIYDIGYMDGQSVDQWIISNPKVHQRLFDKETPYSFFITISTVLLRDAFLSANAMNSLISQIFGKVNNKINFTLEELGRMCVANFILNLKNEQHYHLVSMFNSQYPNEPVTTATAMTSPNFLRYAVGIMNILSDNLESMSTLYNSEGFQRFTPKENQKFYILSDFMEKVKTVVSYAAFNPKDVIARPNVTIPYWQAAAQINDPNAYETIMKIMGTVTDPNTGAHTEKTLDNVLGIMFDYDAMGTYREENMVLTTPVNARAAYYNTFWHEKQLWFNDMSENGVAFFLD